jgi:hypothetical protein
MESVPSISQTDGHADGSEQRAAPRVTLLIRPAKIVTADGEYICVVRDVSATGASVRMFHPLPPCDKAVLYTEAGHALEVEQVWVNGANAGFRFARPVDVAMLLADHGRYPKRRLRIDIELPAVISLLDGEHDAVVRNISQQGARIECGRRLAIEQIVRLRAEDLPEVRAKVRWRRANEYGLIFEDTFQLADFAALTAKLQDAAGTARAPAFN